MVEQKKSLIKEIHEFMIEQNKPYCIRTRNSEKVLICRKGWMAEDVEIGFLEEWGNRKCRWITKINEESENDFFEFDKIDYWMPLAGLPCPPKE